MPLPIVAGALISGGIQLLGGLFGAGAAKKREQAAQREKEQLTLQLNHLENSRQKIINPYENSVDLSGMLSNPMSNLSVATQAAKMQVEEADISLANTLDTLRASGSSAGGATALAQAALKSKMGVSAGIEQQEANNERLRAQGEQTLMQQQMAEKQRMQGVDASGKQFEFGVREDRETAKMDRVAAGLAGAEARQMQAGADRTGALTGMISGLASTAGSYMTAVSNPGSKLSETGYALSADNKAEVDASVADFDFNAGVDNAYQYTTDPYTRST